MSNKTIPYFVSYAFRNSTEQLGFGWSTGEMKNQIHSPNCITALHKSIVARLREDGYVDPEVSIISWQRLEHPFKQKLSVLPVLYLALVAVCVLSIVLLLYNK